MATKDYQFYDENAANIETANLLGGQGNFQTDPRDANCPFYASIKGLFFLGVSVVISWIIFSGNNCALTLANAICFTIAFAFMALCFWWALGYKNHIQGGSEAPSPTLSFIVFIGGIIYASGMVVAALYLWIYQTFHSDYIESNYLRPGDWLENFGGRTLAGAHQLYWWLFFVLVIASLITAVCFAFIVHAAWSMLTNKVQTKKITLSLGLMSIVVFGLISVCCYRKQVWLFAFIFQGVSSCVFNAPFIVYAFIVSAIALAAINALSSLLRSKLLHFIMGALWVVLFVLLALAIAVFLRHLVKFQHDAPFNQQFAAGFLKEQCFKCLCHSKYLYAGQSCGSSSTVRAWDTDQAGERVLDPTCSSVSTDLLLIPLLGFGVVASFVLASIAVVLCTNFALSSAEKDEQYFEDAHVMDYAAVIVIFLLLIFFGLYIWFKGPYAFPSIYGDTKALKLDCMGNLKPGDSFVSLDKSVQQTASMPEGCYKFSSRGFPQTSLKGDFKFGRAGLAAGLLLPNGRFNIGSIDDSSVICPHNTRQHFFPGDMNASSDFLCLAGSAEQVNRAFGNLIICQNNLQEPHGLFLNAMPTDLDKPNATGLTLGQTPLYRNPVAGGISADLSSFVPMQAHCENYCKYVIVAPHKDYVNIKGKLLVKDVEGKFVPYGVPEADLALALYHKDVGKLKFLGFGAYDA